MRVHYEQRSETAPPCTSVKSSVFGTIASAFPVYRHQLHMPCLTLMIEHTMGTPSGAADGQYRALRLFKNVLLDASL